MRILDGPVPFEPHMHLRQKHDMNGLSGWKVSVRYSLGAAISLPHCLETGIWNLAHKSDHWAEISVNVVRYRSSGTTSRGTASLVFRLRMRSFPKTKILIILHEKKNCPNDTGLCYWNIPVLVHFNVDIYHKFESGNWAKFAAFSMTIDRDYLERVARNSRRSD